MAALHSWPPKLSLEQFDPSNTETEICSWPFIERLKINDNRLADFDGFGIQSNSFKQTYLCNGSNANISQSSPAEVPIGNSLSISPQSFYTQPKNSDKLSLSLQRLVKYVMNKSVTSNSKLTFCFDCCRILYPWQLFSTQNRLEKWLVYLNRPADGGKWFFWNSNPDRYCKFSWPVSFPTQQVMNSQRAHCGQLNAQLISPLTNSSLIEYPVNQYLHFWLMCPVLFLRRAPECIDLTGEKCSSDLQIILVLFALEFRTIRFIYWKIKPSKVFSQT